MTLKSTVSSLIKRISGQESFPSLSDSTIRFFNKQVLFYWKYLFDPDLYKVTFDLCIQLGKGDRFYQYPEMRVFEKCHFFIY